MEGERVSGRERELVGGRKRDTGRESERKRQWEGERESQSEGEHCKKVSLKKSRYRQILLNQGLLTVLLTMSNICTCFKLF